MNLLNAELSPGRFWRGPRSKKVSNLVSKLTWCLTSTETTRIIRDGEKGGGVWRWGRGRLYTHRYTVTTRMTPAVRWAAMRAIKLFHYCEGQSHKIVHRPQLLKRKESRSGFEPDSYQPNALPLGQTGSHHNKSNEPIGMHRMRVSGSIICVRGRKECGQQFGA